MNGAFGDDLRLAGEAIWKVLLVSLVLGAGLPAVFALGIRSLAWGTGAQTAGADGSTTTTGGGNPAGRIIAFLLFLLVAYAIVAGLIFIIASGQGKEISFQHVFPSITEKKS
jgi:ABC-type multidrug transport system fused ATPase/permease subunit